MAYLDVDEDVFRLEVTVHDSVGVQLLESQKDLPRVNLHGPRREGRVLMWRASVRFRVLGLGFGV